MNKNQTGSIMGLLMVPVVLAVLAYGGYYIYMQRKDDVKQQAASAVENKIEELKADGTIENAAKAAAQQAIDEINIQELSQQAEDEVVELKDSVVDSVSEAVNE
jgi:flagellar basal body-associated protein FliL